MDKNYAKRLISRFFSKIDKNGPKGCWLWTSGKNNAGYGIFWNGTKGISTHRFMWELSVGSIPDGMCILHKCDNPPCCNPNHLFIGTQQDNMEDMMIKRRIEAKHTLSIVNSADYIETMLYDLNNIPLNVDYNDLNELSSYELGALGTL